MCTYVLNFFPVSVDGECLSSDGRRFGVCLNVYECRMQGGSSRGECALGFGVCCVFVAECEQEIKNNITYIVSPNFPNFLPLNMTSCRVKIRIINEDISQLRIDFNHFLLGQPNRRTGVCDGDVFSLTGGLDGALTLCGQNSGQHIYYDIGGKPKRAHQREGQPEVTNLSPSVANGIQTNLNASLGETPSSTAGYGVNGDALAAVASDSIEILMNFTRSSLVSFRLWEIRVTQIPFSQRAPAGCLQYYTGLQGIIQTFNFADNGRHLANQNYKACIRQERDMCSITYEPCDEESFRIGASALSSGNGAMNAATTPTDSSPASPFSSPVDTTVPSPTTAGTTGTLTSSAATRLSTLPTTEATSPPTPPVTAGTTAASQADDPDAVEGSGGGDIPASAASSVPVRGGFDIFSFFRNTFGFGRHMRSLRRERQLFSMCTDRITIPCIIEDFIEGSLGPVAGCEPVHCGSRFCSSTNGACRIESTVIPFRVGIHFGDGVGKGNPEDNIGMCLRYSQVQCM
ncbi:uncharacterized protein LOC119660700 isoform X2 [Hermetia illucens]|uniref:uncharacterized protein LOC119660700 isoform X2 n=1 Tax=Hermetia illucens TaxID=343691 RepID=UPI0018CC44D9|nr:uncharacterized protein LOC119660700 isoform X2 [Hermetia illucens]